MPTERIARLEAQTEHIKSTLDEVRKTQLEIVATMNQAKGATAVGKWAVPSASALLSFVSAYLGVHLPKP